MAAHQLWTPTCCPLRCLLAAASPLTSDQPSVVSLPPSQTAVCETYSPVPGPKLLTGLNCCTAHCLSRQTADPPCFLFVFPHCLQLHLPSDALSCLQGTTSNTVFSLCGPNVHERLATIKTYLRGTLFQWMRNVSADVSCHFLQWLLVITNDCPLSWTQTHPSLCYVSAQQRLGWSHAAMFRTGHWSRSWATAGVSGQLKHPLSYVAHREDPWSGHTPEIVRNAEIRLNWDSWLYCHVIHMFIMLKLLGNTQVLPIRLAATEEGVKCGCGLKVAESHRESLNSHWTQQRQRRERAFMKRPRFLLSLHRSLLSSAFLLEEDGSWSPLQPSLLEVLPCVLLFAWDSRWKSGKSWAPRRWRASWVSVRSHVWGQDLVTGGGTGHRKKSLKPARDTVWYFSCNFKTRVEVFASEKVFSPVVGQTAVTAGWNCLAHIL